MTANSYTIVVSPAAGSVLCLQLIVRTWLAPITKIRDHPLHIPFLDKLISENGPAENPQEIILNSLPCKCLFLWDLSRHRFQPDCLLRPLNFKSGMPIYLQLVDQIKTAAVSGALRPGEALSSISQLAE